MVDALYTGDLDPTAATTPAELAALLRTVHLRADRPSLRDLEARTRHERTPLSKTVVSEILKGLRFPRKAVMVSFLLACGELDDRIEAWRRAWDRIAASDRSVATAASNKGAQTAALRSSKATVSAASAEVEQLREEVNRLSEDNKRLRLQTGVVGEFGMMAVDQSADTGSRSSRGPEVRKRELAAQLRSLRSQGGLTIEQVAAHLFCSPGKVSRMENGFRSGTLRDVRDLCDLYGVPDAQRVNLMELARQSKQHGWWQDYDVPFSTYIGLESDAALIKSYHCLVVPGLLQTVDYARAVVNAAGQARNLTVEETEERVQIRMTRQRMLTRSDPPELCVIIDEAVLHRIVGGALVMTAQLDRLIEISELEHVSIELIPYGAGCHPGLGGAFDILKFAGPLPGIVYIEGLFGVVYVEKVRDVDNYNRVFRTLREVALDQEESRQQIAVIRRNLEKDH